MSHSPTNAAAAKKADGAGPEQPAQQAGRDRRQPEHEHDA
jgi:hypothetical protein